MKVYTHPSIANTLIQRKDGSSYIKHWSYLRPTLILEVDSKKWETSPKRHSIDTKKFLESSKVDKTKLFNSSF